MTTSAGCKEPACTDLDADGYGDHCSLGADCDDRNPTRNVDCVGVPPPDCSATPTAAGCTCFPGSVANCYTADAATEGVGACRHGVTSCVYGFYGLCRGAVLPATEICNGLDDDCDARVDEQVLSPCGGCDPSCQGVVWGPSGIAFEADPGLALTDEGSLELARTQPSFDGVFLANTAEDTVSHLSAASATEVRRHSSGGDDPTRVAVDYRGDVFVTNRAFGAQGTLTKIASDLGACIDRNGSTTIETSTGPSDVPAAADDECILFSVPVGGIDGVPRAIAIDGSFEPGGGGGGDPWVGLYGDEAVAHVDGETGATIETIPIPGFSPYAAAFDGRGQLWLASEAGELVKLDRSTSPPTVTRYLVNLACYEIYGIAITDENAVLGTGFGCDQVFRFEPSTQAVVRLPTLPSSRAVAIDDGLAYVAHTDGRMSIVDPSLMTVLGTVDAWALGRMPLESIGVAADSLGTVWMFSTHGAANGNGLATRIDPTTRTVLAQVPVGLGPHSQGDGSGRALRGAYVPTGSTGLVVPSCPNPSVAYFANLHVDLDAGAQSTVLLSMRSAATAAELATASFVDVATYPGSPTTLPISTVPHGALLELRLTLLSGARDSSPLVRQIGIEYDCLVDLPE